MAENKDKDKESTANNYILVDGRPIKFGYYDAHINFSSVPIQTIDMKTFGTVVGSAIYTLPNVDVKWPIVQEESSEGESMASGELSEAKIIEQAQFQVIIEKLQTLYDQAERHDTKSTKASQDISAQLDHLINENSELKKLLSQQYSTRGLLHFSITTSIALLASLLIWSRFNIVIIHPAIATVVLIGSIGFSLLAIWRKKHEP